MPATRCLLPLQWKVSRNECASRSKLNTMHLNRTRTFIYHRAPGDGKDPPSFHLNTTNSHQVLLSWYAPLSFQRSTSSTSSSDSGEPYHPLDRSRLFGTLWNLGQRIGRRCPAPRLGPPHRQRDRATTRPHWRRQLPPSRGPCLFDGRRGR